MGVWTISCYSRNICLELLNECHDDEAECSEEGFLRDIQ